MWRLFLDMSCRFDFNGSVLDVFNWNMDREVGESSVDQFRRFTSSGVTGGDNGLLV